VQQCGARIRRSSIELTVEPLDAEQTHKEEKAINGRTIWKVLAALALILGVAVVPGLVRPPAMSSGRGRTGGSPGGGLDR